MEQAPTQRVRHGGRQSALPPGDELEQLLAQPGMTQQMVAEQYGVTFQAVSAKLKRHRAGRAEGNWQKYWPKDWFNGHGVRTDHANTYVYRQVLNYTKRRQGVALDDNATQKLDSFLDVLRSNDLVVFYEYDDANGFRLRARRADDDPNVIWVAGR